MPVSVISFSFASLWRRAERAPAKRKPFVIVGPSITEEPSPVADMGPRVANDVLLIELGGPSLDW